MRRTAGGAPAERVRICIAYLGFRFKQQRCLVGAVVALVRAPQQRLSSCRSPPEQGFLVTIYTCGDRREFKERSVRSGR
jgi:hypothetical protein